MPKAKAQTKKPRTKLERSLAEVARIGAMFIDGDAAESVHADKKSATWISGDDINFKHAPYITVKRTILLIERMQDFPYNAVFALRRADDSDKLEPVVCGMENPRGRAPYPMSKAEQDCIRRGLVATERDPDTGRTWAYAPVRNSDDEIVGLLQVFA